ncbi:jacalin-like lectin domain-containing protein [Tanacetum coccineum]
MATNNFANDNFIGQGGFGRVYKGQLKTSSGEPGTLVAVKRLDKKITGQGRREFLMEIMMLASYKHNNLVSLVGFSDEEEVNALIYKHEVHGSLDMHLATTNLKWETRLEICLGAARGLEYLHDDVGTGHRVIHRDIKSSNILLDGNWEAKISDFGLSTIGPKNQQFTLLVTDACGTLGYIDPQYIKTGILTKESDVFSFGVVMFEVLCGRLAMLTQYDDNDVRKLLYRLTKHLYDEGKLDEIIFPDLLRQSKTCSLEKFAKVAYECLNKDRKQRPTMSYVVQELEATLKLQIVSYHSHVSKV